MSFDHDSALDQKNADDDGLLEVHRRAMRRFDECAYPQQEMRANSLQARRFVSIPGAQWEGEWGEQFDKAVKIEIDKIGRGLRKIENDYRENRIVPDYRPDGPSADQITADTLDGLHRADSYHFKAQQARDNAVLEAISGGFGAYRLTNEWDDESDPDNDYQRVNPAAIITDADQSVFFDLNARLYDKSDARFAFIRTALTADAHKDAFGDDAKCEFPDGALWKMTDWFSVDTVAVAEYYEVEDASEALWIFTHTISGEERRIWSGDLEKGQLDAMAADGWEKRRQNRKRRRVRKYVISGAEVLEDRGYIAGDQIPIVPVYGRRYFVENQERWQGYVQPKMDAQRLYNSNVSRLAETNSLSPREVPIFAPEQMVGNIPQLWARANIDRLPYLLAEPIRNEAGEIVQNGPVAYLKPPELAPVTAALMQISNGDLTEDSLDGADEVRANISAEAMDIAATRVDAKSGVYLDNIRQSVQREGEIYFRMVREIYVEEGREVEVMSEDGDDGLEVLKKAVTDPQSGSHTIANDLESGRYKVIVSVTEATATRRDKTVRSMMNIAQAAQAIGDTQLGQAALYTAVLNTDGEGSDDMIAWVRKQALTLGLVQPNEEELEAMQKAASEEGQQTDPMQQLAESQSKLFESDAMKNMAEVRETLADTDLKVAKTEEIRAGLNRPVAVREAQ